MQSYMQRLSRSLFVPKIHQSVIIEGDAKKLTVDNFSRKDSISVAGETFDYKDIKNGADVPGVKVNLA